MEFSPLLWARAIERLLIVVFAGASLAFGWDLFRRGILNVQAAEFSALKGKAKLQRVAPGIFFALFGTVILAFSLTKEYRRGDAAVDNPQRLPVSESFIGADEQKIRLVTALNTLDQLMKSNPPSGEFNKAALQTAMTEVLGLRNEIVSRQFDREQMALYVQHSDQYFLNPSSVSPQTREVIKRIEPWMTRTFASEVK